MESINYPKYLITGVDKQGKRFKIYTDNPNHYNLQSGTIWKINEFGKRRRIAQIRNFNNN